MICKVDKWENLNFNKGMKNTFKNWPKNDCKNKESMMTNKKKYKSKKLK